MTDKFKNMTWYNKVMVVAGTITAVGTIIAALGLGIPKVVWADEFYSFQHEIYTKELNSLKKDLRAIKIQEYQITQEMQPVPEFIVQEKLELEDEIKEVEQKIEKIEQEVEQD